MPFLAIRRLRPADQAAARALILQGMEERWGWVDEQRNPDLRDICAHYADGVFLVAWQGDRLIATGALTAEQGGVGRIQRMSVARDCRRQGVGSAMLAALLAHARARGYHRVVLETTSTWRDAVHFYEQHGFYLVAHRADESHFALRLHP